MEAFPVAPEIMQAFPLGSMNLMVAVASAVAAQHGVEPARRLCAELANNDEVWTYIAARLGRLELGDEAPDTDRGTPPLAEPGEGPIAVQASTLPDREPVTQAADPGNEASHRADETSALTPEVSASELGGETTVVRTRPRKSRRRGKSKANGSGQ